uniref:Uncharacterized protein n=1 Tax=Sphaerodactylus townsendi TaxID=933632 RepID=A0ACB8EZQ9_9SAUR
MVMGQLLDSPAFHYSRFYCQNQRCIDRDLRFPDVPIMDTFCRTGLLGAAAVRNWTVRMGLLCILIIALHPSSISSKRGTVPVKGTIGYETGNLLDILMPGFGRLP